MKNLSLLSVSYILNANQKGCIILHNETYSKKMLYHGKIIWKVNYQSISTCSNSIWYNVDMPKWRGPKFLTRSIPISKLIAVFFEQNELIVQAIS